MKRLLLLPLLLLATVTYSQESVDTNVTEYLPVEIAPDYDGENYFPYVVGSTTIPGYKIEIRTCTADNVTLKNGRRIAGLSCIVSEEESYIGGNLIFEGDTTTIVSVSAEAVGKNGAKFIVKGEEFNMELTLLNGIILLLEDNRATFNTEGVGIWTIEKKV